MVSLPATAFGFNPPDPDIMHKPPRSADEPIVGRWLLIRYVIVGAYVGGATVFGNAWWYLFYHGGLKLTFHQLSHYDKCSTLFPELDCIDLKLLMYLPVTVSDLINQRWHKIKTIFV
jgi:Ca2+ transporting ATPase